MGRNRAAYMREYRAKRNRALLVAVADGIDLGIAAERITTDAARQRVAELEEEVRFLKTELARRSMPAERAFGHPRPAPKSGQRPL